MEIATVMLAIAGDKGNTVMKTDVTPSEVAVLRYLHGEDAVNDIEVTGEIKRKHNEERERLAESYGRQIGERKVAVAVNALFPGAAARLFDTFSELDLPDDFYKAEARKVPTAPKSKPARKAEPKGAPKAAAEPEDEGEDEDDGGEEMPDNKMFA
jgi:hypothetical protein